MSLEEIGAALREVLDKVDASISAHHDAADLAEQARDLLAAAAYGSQQADVEQVCELFDAGNGCRRNPLVLAPTGCRNSFPCPIR